MSKELDWETRIDEYCDLQFSRIELPTIKSTIKFIVRQELTAKEDTLRKALEGLENPYKSIGVEEYDLAEWALIEGGKHLGFSRAKEEMLSLLTPKN